MDGLELRSNGQAEFKVERKDPFLYFHVHLNIPNSCTVIPRKNGPAVVIDAGVK